MEPRFHIELGGPDLDELYSELKSVGIEPEGPPTARAWGVTDLRVIDPDGNIPEFDARAGSAA